MNPDKYAGHTYHRIFSKEKFYCVGKYYGFIALQGGDPLRDIWVPPIIFILFWKRDTKEPKAKWKGLQEFKDEK